jgi:predicted RNA-binding Zn ribbon-like protein
LIFTHDTEVALVAAAALINTDQSDADSLANVADLEAFLKTWRWTGTHTGQPAELAAVRELRPTLAALWTVDEPTAVGIVNDLLVKGHALPQLVKHDEWDYHIHATTPAAPLAQRMAVEAAMAMLDVIRQHELGRLLTCGAGDCSDVYVDLSKNRSRRFCSVTCGNRANVAAYRARQR